MMGAVEKPGVYDVSGQKTILDMLALSGGLKEDAGQLLFLIRPPRLEETTSKEKKESDEQGPRTFVIDLEELLFKGDFTLNLTLNHGDIIRVQTSGNIYIGGEVRSPGTFPLKGKKLTVGRAIIMAGGLKGEANGSETKIFRHSEKGSSKEILSVNVYAIQKGEQEDLFLKENDIIMVPKSGSKTFFSELWDFIKGRIGVVGMGSL